MHKTLILTLGICLFIYGCSSFESKQVEEDYRATSTVTLVDKNALPQVVRLYASLKKNSKVGFMFGHEDSFSYGMGWKYEQDSNRNDVFDVVGDYPGVFGWDLGHLEIGNQMNIDSVSFQSMRRTIARAYELGAVNTLSWHPLNPVTGGNTWDRSQTVRHILPGGECHAKYREWLIRLSDYIKELKTANGEQIPVVWRPYHEHNGGWFWWGSDSTSVHEYVDLWKYTVHFFRDSMDVHNLLWAYSPNSVESEEEYLERYPGDEYVDILGIDVYDSPQYGLNYKEEVPRNIHILKSIATRKNKVYAFTETGYNGIPDSTWWTQSLLPAIDSSGIAWILVWRNSHTAHYYAPYPGQKSEADFKKFYELPQSLFARDVKDLNK